MVKIDKVSFKRAEEAIKGFEQLVSMETALGTTFNVSSAYSTGLIVPFQVRSYP